MFLVDLDTKSSMSETAMRGGHSVVRVVVIIVVAFVLVRIVYYPNEPKTIALPDELSCCTLDCSSASRRCDVRINSSALQVRN